MKLFLLEIQPLRGAMQVFLALQVHILIRLMVWGMLMEPIWVRFIQKQTRPLD